MKTLMTLIAATSLFASMPVMAQDQSATSSTHVTATNTAPNVESRWHPWWHHYYHHYWGPRCYFGFFGFYCRGDIAPEQPAE